jgi:hypothetical protein
LDNPVVVVGSQRAALAFLGSAWRRAWLVMLLAAVAIFACATVPQGLAATACLATTALCLLMACGALWRSAMGVTGMGPGGVQLGAVELRLLAVTILSVVFMTIVGLLALIVLLAFAYATASAGHGFAASDISTWTRAADGRGRIVLAVVAALCGAGVLWCWARISLAAAASVSRERVQMLASWPITRGRVGEIVLTVGCAAALTAIALVFVLEAGASFAVVAPVGLGVSALLVTGLWLPWNIGLMAYLYQRFEMSGSAVTPP